ncbi:RsmB/NOP family class I SAM-dependent RNA methyltransferase [Denitrobacterium detoxificans]|jgi:16S rRNA (cytosine967-C5)-methyltransferase|uniref:RsmB/NOP family class I SAM-dependent RNA methyltransferase n=1 Tax=Denitrobacterium detoxificans TaxID=79604 RepID=UPI0026EB87F2|nr:transcription antitermination factor NusB [Denitrobacterium detoxificans]MBE6466045.1 antitermination protein NusB [Denitrobacterium detoxificans]
MAKLSPARRAAVEVCATVRQRQAFASDVLTAYLRDAKLSASDAGFARVLVLGVVATWGTLDEVINRCLNTPRDVQDDVRDALRISTYEVIFLGKDAHAVVDQGVELVRHVQPKAARLANAVLRKIVRAKLDFPFANPHTDDAALGRKHGFPAWLAEQLIAQLGRHGADVFMKASNHPAPVFFAVPGLKVDEDRVKRTFAREGVTLESVTVASHAVPGCYHAPSTAVAAHAAQYLFREGGLLVSDAAAQVIASRVLPEQPGTFLEIGSGRGTKTILIQAHAHRMWGKQMQLTAIDNHGFKADLLRKRAQQFGVELEGVRTLDARDLSALGKMLYDGVFLDAPCSGVGTLRRHPEIRWRLRPADVRALSELQLQMLSEASTRVKVGGRLAYATCTVLAQENEQVVKAFLESDQGKGFRLVPWDPEDANKARGLFFKSPLTAAGTDAHFAALFMRVQ